MEKLNYLCPCGGKLKWKRERIIRDGIDCGILDIEYCAKCSEPCSNDVCNACFYLEKMQLRASKEI